MIYLNEIIWEIIYEEILSIAIEEYLICYEEFDRNQWEIEELNIRQDIGEIYYLWNYNSD